MRILANENLSRDLVAVLRAAGHDVAWVKEDACGIPDEEVLARAQREHRIVATFDKGFGRLAFRRGLPAECGVLLLRVFGPTPRATAEMIVHALCTRADWRGVFATITASGIRVRPLARASGQS
jgi:predicted nuclease of predicted toxin-antitoxin system